MKQHLLHFWLEFDETQAHINLDTYFYNKNAKNFACQEDQVAARFDFVIIGLYVVLCLTQVGRLAQIHAILKDISDPGHFVQ